MLEILLHTGLDSNSNGPSSLRSHQDMLVHLWCCICYLGTTCFVDFTEFAEVAFVNRKTWEKEMSTAGNIWESSQPKPRIQLGLSMDLGIRQRPSQGIRKNRQGGTRPGPKQEKSPVPKNSKGSNQTASTSQPTKKKKSIKQSHQTAVIFWVSERVLPTFEPSRFSNDVDFSERPRLANCRITCSAGAGASSASELQKWQWTKWDANIRKKNVLLLKEGMVLL